MTLAENKTFQKLTKAWTNVTEKKWQTCGLPKAVLSGEPIQVKNTPAKPITLTTNISYKNVEQTAQEEALIKMYQEYRIYACMVFKKTLFHFLKVQKDI